jgi:pimeloyl-ACP methyl ester carboxylesterase
MKYPDMATPSSHLHPSDLHGLSRLAVDGVLGTTALVEQLHYTIARISAPLGKPGQGQTRGITGLVYRSIHQISGAVGKTADFGFSRIVPRLQPRSSTPEREQLLAIVNGVLGDHLDATANPLAIAMNLRIGGQPLVLDAEALVQSIQHPRRKLLIVIHGLCRNDLQWTPDETMPGGCLPSGLAEALGYTPLHLHYNTGRHISTNGRELAGLLETLVREWPEKVEELVLLGHSMGGLVARSACHYGAENDHGWLESVTRVVMLGSPHHGAPLERVGHKVDKLLALSPYSAPFTRLGKIRSAGITDLRHGSLRDRDWMGQDRFAQSHDQRHPVTRPEHIVWHAVAATSDSRSDSLKSRYLGDGLVPIDSALGRHPDPDWHLPIAPDHQFVVHNTRHLGLIHHPEVHRKVHEWLS